MDDISIIVQARLFSIDVFDWDFGYGVRTSIDVVATWTHRKQG
jgi:hypothetical protein